MKDIILTIIAAITLFAAGCTKVSHNANLVGVGKVFKVGAGDYGITYVNGLVGIQAVRENTEMVVETNDGDSFANPASAVKGLRSIRFRTGPQVTGYLVDLSEKNADAATQYVRAMPKMNTAQWDAKQDKPIETKLSNTKTSDGSSSSIDIDKIKDAAKEAIGKLNGKTGIDGDGEYKDLDKDDTIAAQRKLANALLKFDDDGRKFDDTGETYSQTLKDFITRLDKLEKAKQTKTLMRLKSATVKDGKLTAVLYTILDTANNVDKETTCPSCWGLDVVVED